MMTRRFCGVHWKSRAGRGVVSIEAALVLPLLLLLSFGIIEYSWLFLRHGEVTNAVRHAARVGARADASSAEVTAALERLMAEARLGGSGYELTISPGEVGNLAAGEMLTIGVTIPYGNIEVIGFPLLPLPEQLRAVVTMAKEGP